MSDNDPQDVRAWFSDAIGAGQPAVFDLGRLVVCDACDEDFTDDTRSGGFLFGSYAYGPCCEAKQLRSIRGYGEEGHIGGFCPDGVSFADWIRGLRNSVPGGNEIRITPGMPGRQS
jgi:hypothetical protein